MSIKVNKLVNILLALFVFVLIVDPSDGIFRIKMPLFFMLLVICSCVYFKILANTFLPVMWMYMVLLITSVLNFFSTWSYSSEMTIHLYKTFFMWMLIPWMLYLKMLEKIFLPTIAISILVMILYVLFLTSPFYLEAIYSFLCSYNYDIVPIAITNRNFLGVEILGIYYKTSAIFVFPMSISLYHYMTYPTCKCNNLLLYILFFGVLFLGSTRANMLSAIIVSLLILFKYSGKTKLGKQIIALCSVIAVVCLLVLLFFILTDTDEQSMEVKYGMLDYYIKLFDTKPSILLWGQGAGAMFDSGNNAHGITSLTEWTVLELIRWFGVPFTLSILVIYFTPLWFFYIKKNKLEYAFPLGISYFFYILIACTNPLLLSSTGTLALLIGYSYALNPSYEKGLL